MRGTIDHIKKWQGTYFFIQGDDGNRYYGTLNELSDKQQYRFFAWKGNRATFDVLPANKEDRYPSAVNIVLDEVPDPELKRKTAQREAAKASRKAKQKRIWKRRDSATG